MPTTEATPRTKEIRERVKELREMGEWDSDEAAELESELETIREEQLVVKQERAVRLTEAVTALLEFGVICGPHNNKFQNNAELWDYAADSIKVAPSFSVCEQEIDMPDFEDYSRLTLEVDFDPQHCGLHIDPTAIANLFDNKVSVRVDFGMVIPTVAKLNDNSCISEPSLFIVGEYEGEFYHFRLKLVCKRDSQEGEVKKHETRQTA